MGMGYSSVSPWLKSNLKFKSEEKQDSEISGKMCLGQDAVVFCIFNVEPTLVLIAAGQRLDSLHQT